MLDCHITANRSSANPYLQKSNYLWNWFLRVRQWCCATRCKLNYISGGTKTQWRVKGCLERSWLVEWECGWEPVLDRTAKERHIRLHCMHMPGEMGIDRPCCTEPFAQVEHYPMYLQCLRLGGVWVVNVEFSYLRWIMMQSLKKLMGGFISTSLPLHAGFPWRYDPYWHLCVS